MIVATNTVYGQIMMKVWIGVIIRGTKVIAYSVMKNVPVIQIVGPLNAEAILTIAVGGKMVHALQS